MVITRVARALGHVWKLLGGVMFEAVVLACRSTSAVRRQGVFS